ncbi:hypothetical protein BT63DRAFT_456351 [Microthyrium microscopicum]|uniref:Uncharacterized protein n=1 Tax=Microthyrium microscopicum TaxID=703497 RepID=A0A6A6U954_9PEZI|nr:hypothetical protein BT63DRAFT_456351 [Microthyrium microscopicum]
MSDPSQWHSSRCLRLLRPLRAHLAALERSYEAKAQQKEIENAAGSMKALAKEKLAHNPEAAYMPERQSKQAKYCSKLSRKRKRNAPVPSATPLRGYVEMPTIFRQRNSEQEETVRTENQENEIKAVVSRPRKSRQLPSFSGLGIEIYEDGVKRSYLAILQLMGSPLKTKFATETIPKITVRTKVPSLRTMAVRALADALHQEESEQRNIRADERCDASEEVFGALNDLPAAREADMTLQMQLLRAYATTLVCQAIRGRRLTPEFGIQLGSEIGSCAPEVRDILDAAASAIRPDTTLKNCKRSSMIYTIDRVLDKAQEWAVLSKQPDGRIPKSILCELLQNPSFPVDFLSLAKFEGHWDRVVEDVLFSNSPDTEFLLDALRKGCGISSMTSRQLWALQHVPANGYQNGHSPNYDCTTCKHHGLRQIRPLQESFTALTASLFCILTSLVVVGTEEYTTRPKETDVDVELDLSTGQQLIVTAKQNVNLLGIRSVLHRLACEILDSDVDDWIFEKRHARECSIRCSTVLFCALLIENTTDVPESLGLLDVNTIVKFMLDMDSTVSSLMEEESGILETLPSLLVSICKSCTQLTDISVEEYLKNIDDCFGSMASLNKKSHNFLRRVCHDAANELDIVLPNSSQTRKDTSSVTKSTPIRARRTSFDEQDAMALRMGYRFESMLSEWVAATPARPARPTPRKPAALLVPQMELCPRKAPNIRETQPKRVAVVIKQFRASTISMPPPALPAQRSVIPERLTSRNPWRATKGKTIIIPDSSSETESDQDDITLPKPKRVMGSLSRSSINSSTSSLSSSSPRNRTVQVVIPSTAVRKHTRRISDLIWSSSPTKPEFSPEPQQQPERILTSGSQKPKQKHIPDKDAYDWKSSGSDEENIQPRRGPGRPPKVAKPSRRSLRAVDKVDYCWHADELAI